jgi:hypothetical protein
MPPTTTLTALPRSVFALALMLMPVHALLAQPNPRPTALDRYPIPWEIENVRMIQPPSRGLREEPRCSPPITPGLLAILLEQATPSRGPSRPVTPSQEPLPWCTAAFTWRKQPYRADFFVGGYGRLVFPDGTERPLDWSGERGADRDGVTRDMDAPAIRAFVRFLATRGLEVRPEVRRMRHWEVRLPGTGPDGWIDVSLLVLPAGWTNPNRNGRMYSVFGYFNAEGSLYLFDYDAAPQRAAVRARVLELFKCYPDCGPARPAKSPAPPPSTR